MKATHYVLALGFPALTSTGSFAAGNSGSIVSEATAICIARKAVAPYCSQAENCMVTTEKVEEHWIITLQEASKRITGELIPVEAGRSATVEIDGEGNATATVPKI